MFFNNTLLMATNGQPVYMLPQMATRHGLITGATGTGKTVTVKVMAEAFSDAGVPVFLSDIKGDLAGMSLPGVNTEDMQSRIERFGLAQLGWQYRSYPTVYWDVFAKKGIPVRATVSEMGPLLMSRLMDLSSAQEGVLNIIFKIADDQGLLLLDLKDLRAVVQAVGDHAADYKTAYGNIAGASIGAIQRGLLKLETQGAPLFFGEPALDIMDWIRCDSSGRGVINVLNCEELFQKPDLYTAFLLWMLSELYETLPEVGDIDKPRMVFFFDEAHLLFKLKSKELLDKVEQVIRLIRSKGVGVFFITQNPADIPDTVLSQLGNKIQHALRAYTPAEQKAVRAAAQSYAVNPAFNTQEVIPQLGKGEALVSFLDAGGTPQMVQRAFILPPQSQMGTVDDAVLGQAILSSDMYPKYSQAYDRHSAYELLNGIMPSGVTLQNSFPSGWPSQGAAPVYPEAASFGGFTPAAQPAAQDTSWTCPVCQNVNTGNFCGNCGNPKPAIPQSGPELVLTGAAPAQQAPAAFTTNYQQSVYEQNMASPAMQSYAQPAANYQQTYAQPVYGQQGNIGGAYQGPSLVQAVQAQQTAQAAQMQQVTQAELEKMKKEAVRQAKAELKAEQEANKESAFSKSAKSIATSGARTAVNYLVRGALGSLIKR